MTFVNRSPLLIVLLATAIMFGCKAEKEIEQPEKDPNKPIVQEFIKGYVAALIQKDYAAVIECLEPRAQSKLLSTILVRLLASDYLESESESSFKPLIDQYGVRDVLISIKDKGGYKKMVGNAIVDDAIIAGAAQKIEKPIEFCGAILKAAEQQEKNALSDVLAMGYFEDPDQGEVTELRIFGDRAYVTIRRVPQKFEKDLQIDCLSIAGEWKIETVNPLIRKWQ